MEYLAIGLGILTLIYTAYIYLKDGVYEDNF